jgi:hypothetical protein
MSKLTKIRPVGASSLIHPERRLGGHDESDRRFLRHARIRLKVLNVINDFVPPFCRQQYKRTEVVI